jgi:putative tryptophan/tyrosine transport system substrate-binding protein
MTAFIGRREFNRLLCSAAAAWPLAARGQQGERVRRVGVLMGVGENDPEGQARVAAFQQGLADLNWTDGRNVHIDYRWAAGETDRMRAYTAELVALAPDVLVGNGTSALTALRDATQSIPIVFILVNDPVGQGFIANLARPGGNITGFSFLEYSMIGPPTPLEIRAAPVGTQAEIEQAVAKLAKEPGSGLLVPPDTYTLVHRGLIISSAAQHRLPAIFTYRQFAREGALITYGPETTDIFQRAASYVDRILKGANPGDLPAQAPTKFELAINLRTARMLGLDVPPTLLALADEVIE